MKKQKRIRKTLSLLLCLAFSTSFLSTSAFATDSSTPPEEPKVKITITEDTAHDPVTDTTTEIKTEVKETTTETPLGDLIITDTKETTETTDANQEVIKETESTEHKEVLNVDEYGHTITDTSKTSSSHEIKPDGTTIDQTLQSESSVIIDKDGNTLQDAGSAEGTETTVGEKTENTEDLSVTFEDLTHGTETDASTPPKPQTTGDLKESDTDKNYDQTTTTETPRELTATLVETEILEGAASSVALEKGLESVQPEYTGKEKDLYAHSGDQYSPSGTAPDGYDFYYSGYTGDSDYGAKQTEGNGSTEYSDIIQFELTEKNSGDKLAVYCVDLSTGTQGGWWYSVENLEDADYYSADDAKHIRAIVTNGYWGVADPKPPVGADKPADPPETGSLAYMKAAMKQAILDNPTAANGLTADDVDKMTEGEAMAITQMAIWKYGNQIDGDFTLIPSNYNGGNESSYTGDQNPSEATQAAWNRISKLSALMASLSQDSDNATEVLSPDKFISDLTLTVKDKVDGHANNQDASDTNDAYNTDLSFVLEVVITEKDELMIKVMDADGNEIRSAKLGAKGSAAAADTILPDENGTYTISNLTLIEGDVSFSMKLEGAQYLEEGVYIYSSESRKENNRDTSAQTFVGIANGYQAVDLSMKVELEFEVDEGTVTTERQWKDSWGEYITIEYKDDDGGDEDEPKEHENGDDHTVKTGDDSNIQFWGIGFVVSASAALIIMLLLLKRKRT